MTWELIYLFTLHFVADFMLQSREIGRKKTKEIDYLLLHGIGVLYTFAAAWYIFGIGGWELALVNSVIHMIIDANIWRLYYFTVWWRNPYVTPSRWKYWEDYWFYFTIGLDQLLHIITILLLVEYLPQVLPWLT